MLCPEDVSFDVSMLKTDRRPSQTGIGLGKVNSGIRKPWVLFFGMAADGTVQLTIVYAASGSFLTSLAWPAAASVSSLQRELQKHTPTGAVGTGGGGG